MLRDIWRTSDNSRVEYTNSSLVRPRTLLSDSPKLEDTQVLCMLRKAGENPSSFAILATRLIASELSNTRFTRDPVECRSIRSRESPSAHSLTDRPIADKCFDSSRPAVTRKHALQLRARPSQAQSRRKSHSTRTVL
jgi:hypothetical protein